MQVGELEVEVYNGKGSSPLWSPGAGCVHNVQDLWGGGGGGGGGIRSLAMLNPFSLKMRDL